MDEYPEIPGIYYCIPAGVVFLLVVIFSTGAARAMGRMWDRSHPRAFAIHIQRLITRALSHFRNG